MDIDMNKIIITGQNESDILPLAAIIKNSCEGRPEYNFNTTEYSLALSELEDDSNGCIFVYCPLEYVVANNLKMGNSTDTEINTVINRWTEQCNKMLHFYYRNSERCLFMNINTLTDVKSISALADSLDSIFGIPVDATALQSIKIDTHHIHLELLFAKKFVDSQQPIYRSVFNELQSIAHVPGGEVENSEVEPCPLAQYQTLVRDKETAILSEEEAKLKCAELINAKKKLQSINNDLIASEALLNQQLMTANEHTATAKKELQVQTAANNQAHSTADQTITELKKQNVELTKQKKQDQTINDSLTSSDKSLNEQLIIVKEHTATAKKELQAQTAANNQARSTADETIKELDKTTTALKKQNVQIVNQKKQIQSINDSLTSSEKLLNQQLITAKEHTTTAKKELRVQTAANNQARSTADKTINELDKESTALKTQNVELANQKQQIQSINDNLTSSEKSLNQQLITAKKELQVQAAEKKSELVKIKYDLENKRNNEKKKELDKVELIKENELIFIQLCTVQEEFEFYYNKAEILQNQKNIIVPQPGTQPDVKYIAKLKHRKKMQKLKTKPMLYLTDAVSKAFKSKQR
jgi:hypothetical protein